jgi:hypothetical protein
MENLIKDTVFETIKKTEDIELSPIELIEVLCVLSNLAVTLLLVDEEEVKEHLKNAKLSYSFPNRYKILKTFLDNHAEWVLRNCDDKDTKINITCKEDEDEEDDFFEFDSEEVDDSINDMHYDTRISAKEFMSTQDIDEDILEDIKDALEEMESFIIRYENMEIDNKFIEEVVDMLGKFVIFEFIPEFKHLGLSLEGLRGILIDLDIDSLDSAKKELLKNYIISIFEDLEKWYDEVVIKQTAQDIHYLDAALLANITQMDLIIK